MYKPVDPKVSFPKMEEDILAFWQEHGIFEKSIARRAGAEEYVFYDGPPFATGLPHFGHFVPGTVKDIFPRYKTMRGYKVERRFGWDCHGLPVEYEMEKELGISGKRQIEEYGVARFNEACRSIVLRYVKEWRQIVTRMGRWVDFDNDYKTMDPDYMETIWWVMKQLWEKGLLYEGYYILPYCPRCSTVLSNHELNLGGYQDVHDPAITVRFRVKDDNPKGWKDTYILAWTTTPWTLPSNLALALGPDIEYVRVKDGEEYYVLAKERLSTYYRSEDEYEIVETFTGKDAVGIPYEPLFPYFADLADQGAFRTWTGEFVTTEEGTGIVHIAPGFGEDDYHLLKDSGLPVVCPVDAEGRFTGEVGDYEGLFVKDADKEIIRRLKEEGKLVKREQYLHAYPHCWRCKSPLIYRAISSWFVAVEKIKERMIANNEKIYWMPSHIKHGRFGKWLENARDWAISRNRYWGNPLPIWRCEACGHTECIGSRQELKEKSGVWPEDLHKHFVDKITYPCPSCGGTMRRIPEVLDCWFESGAMPYAQNHYPFENKEKFERHFPADFVCEGIDQTRGWFYTLLVLSTALFDEPPFLNNITTGLVLAADGKKMSKSERNYTDPKDVIETFGADALRLFLMHSAVVRAEELRYSDEGVREVLKNVLIPLWNAYAFFVTYANIDGIRPTAPPEDPAHPLDRWILSEAQRLVLTVTEEMDRYDLVRAIDPIVAFIDSLNNWYIRRSRRRFWKSESDADKREAYATLWTVLMTLVKVAAPIVPFITEEIYRNLRTEEMPESVHLCDWPEVDERRRDTVLEEKMRIVRRAVSLGRALRSEHNIKTRQPLRTIYLVTRDEHERRVLMEMEDIVREELNVKQVVYRENEDDVVEYRAKPNYPVLGKRLGPLMKKAARRIEALSMEEIKGLLDGATLVLDLDGERLELTSEGIVVQRIEKAGLKVLNEGSLTVALDTELSAELVREGLVRDFVRVVQNFRKEKGLEVTDRIRLHYQVPDDLAEAIEAFKEYVMNETLAVALVPRDDGQGLERVACGDAECGLVVERVEE
ncbi:Isoleucyl-tRNA synthetase [Spirochaeta thermophila DSM 6578]|uniref:Isoleucine--tRNA ligase n=1 Tax=Winmispira thermophila (strain ATCC 700085 / DSM 6578 / Z-1203) TaxID=869211 RepID=G0GB96_WINT7|nr:isoleucine--tRNA ligase [Spirochaeta thermophila]AEJ61905.1 Isoleucyl-tRNA synthetase [Spirochaeta thermophila DSM 6578]